MSRHKRKNKSFRRLLTLAIICLILLSLYNSSHKLSISEYDINSTRLSSEFDGFRIVQLSDLHGAEFGDALYEKVRDLQPDIIALTGDFITTAEDLPAVERLVSKLVTLTDVYYISGNHDYGSGEIDALAEILDRYGVTFLRNEYEIIDRDGAQLVVAGVEDPNSWADMIQPEEFAEGIRTEYPDTFTLLLSHRNYWATEYPQLPVDLILCGHTHGGIVRFPGVGGIFSTERTLFPDYEAGLYSCGQYDMIVSRGLGNSAGIPRLFNRPEIVSITLHAN